MLSKEQLASVKEQLIKQIESFPEPQKSSMKTQIEEMSDEQFEEFLVKNKLISIQNEGNEKSHFKGQESPFRLIIEGKIPAYKIAENSKALAVLEINPITKGHTIIIPKRPVKENDIPSQAFSLANKVAKKIKLKFKCSKVSISTSEIIGEGIIQVLPVYNDEHLGMPRRKAAEEELKSYQEILGQKKKERTKIDSKNRKITKGKNTKIKQNSKKEIKLPKAPIRIP
ncbi:MAG: HIT domain-containing protein [Candidatus Pacearchaeota archaeon]